MILVAEEVEEDVVAAAGDEAEALEGDAEEVSMSFKIYITMINI